MHILPERICAYASVRGNFTKLRASLFREGDRPLPRGDMPSPSCLRLKHTQSNLNARYGPYVPRTGEIEAFEPGPSEPALIASL